MAPGRIKASLLQGGAALARFECPPLGMKQQANTSCRTLEVPDPGMAQFWMGIEYRAKINIPIRA